MTGKEKCNLMKEVRKQIAIFNNIQYEPSKCNYEGPCKGTCPICESENAWLSKELDRKKENGEFVSIIGISCELVDQALEIYDFASLKYGVFNIDDEEVVKRGTVRKGIKEYRDPLSEDDIDPLAGMPRLF